MSSPAIPGLFLVGWGLVSICVFALLREIGNTSLNRRGLSTAHRTYQGNKRISSSLLYMAWATPAGLFALLLGLASEKLVHGDGPSQLLSFLGSMVIYACFVLIFFLAIANFWISEFKSSRTMEEAVNDPE